MVWSAEFGHLSLNKFLDKGDPISGSVTTHNILKCLLIKLPKEILVFQQGEDLWRILRPRNFVATYWWPDNVVMEPVSGHAPIFTPDYPESVRWSPCNPDIIDAGPRSGLFISDKPTMRAVSVCPAPWPPLWRMTARVMTVCRWVVSPFPRCLELPTNVREGLPLVVSRHKTSLKPPIIYDFCIGIPISHLTHHAHLACFEV